MSNLGSPTSRESQLGKSAKTNAKQPKSQLESKQVSKEESKATEGNKKESSPEKDASEVLVAGVEQEKAAGEQTADQCEIKKVCPSPGKHFGTEKPGLLMKLAGNLAGRLDNSNVLNIECPDIIIVRMFDVICSWQKFTKELTHFTRMGLFNYLKRNWFEPYLMQLIDDLRIQSSNDNRFYHDSPMVHSWTHSSIQVQQTAYQYVCWKLTTDGGYDVGRHTLPHNQIQKLFWYHLLKTNKLQVHLYPDVKNTLEQMKKKTKLVLLSSCTAGPISGQLKLISFSQYGDLTALFSDFLDTADFDVNKEEGYQKLTQKLGANSKILLITSSLVEARLAQKNNINPLLIIREDSLAGAFLESFEDIPIVSRLDEIKLKGQGRQQGPGF